MNEFNLPKEYNWQLAHKPIVKKYVALLTQSGTNAPVATVLENTLEAIVEFAYNNTGSYSMIFDKDLFEGPGLAAINIGNNFMVDTGGSFTASVQAYPVIYNEIVIETLKGVAFNDGLLGSIVDGFGNPIPNMIEITVYNK